MKDEIKEILDFLDDDNRERPFGISNHDLKILRDYITDLQQKYNNSQITLVEEWKKRLEAEEKIKHLDNQITMLKQQNNSITTIGLDYKSRIDKAIDYIYQYREVYYPDAPQSEPIISYNLGIYEEEFDEEKIVHILKGDDENGNT